MRALDIAIKDLKQFARDLPALVMSLAAPLALTAMIGFAFGGLGGGTPQLQLTTLQVANLDQGQPGSALKLGQELLEILQGPGFEGIVQVSLAADEASARAAVESRQVEAALIVPPGFTAAVASPAGEPAEVLLYHDPALTLRPSVVGSAIQGVLDLFSGSQVAAHLTGEMLAARGAPPAVIAEAAARVAGQYVHGAQERPLLTIRQSSLARATSEGFQALLNQIYAGMLVFFVFFTAATTAETILKEDEERTLARLFTTPTPRATILAGKFASVLLVVLVQAAVLVVAAALLFGTRWGNVAGLAVQLLATVIVAGGLGLLLVSFARDTRQAGYLLGAVLTVLGMAGGLFTVGFTNLPRAFDTMALLTPHGWAMKGWRLLLRGEGVEAVLGPAAVCVAAGILLFALGALRFRRRYA
jgi:ABC-2 type transport system permease protein